jgi:DNA-binding transcriptional MerR regulator
MKNLLILVGVALLLGLGYFIFTKYQSFSELKKQEKILLKKIERFQSLDDSLAKISDALKEENLVLENKLTTDSLVLDSLKDEYTDARHDANVSEKQAMIFKNKYHEVKTKIVYLESNIIMLQGDSLLLSLSKKIN